MNLPRGCLSLGKPGRLAPAAWVSIALSALGFRPALGVWQGPSGPAYQAAEADVLPASSQPAAPELQLHKDNAEKADALASFSQAIIAEDNADSDKALDDYQKALALDPGYTELAVKVAFELARRGDPSSGIQVLKDSIKASPKAPLPYLYLSQLYAKYLGKSEIGLKYAQQALDLDPSNFAAYVAVYEICLTTGQTKKAVDTLDRAAKQPSTDPQYWLQLGEYYLKTLGDTPSADQINKAAAIFHQALAYCGNDVQSLARVGDFFSRVHREQEAIPIYLKAIKFSPANPPDGDQTLPAIRDSLARCFDSVGRTAEAIAILRQIIKDNPLQYESYDILCGLYEKTDQTDAALAICQQMMLLQPEDFRNYIRNAALLLKQKKMDAAIRALNDARNKFPTEAQITYSLGLAYSEAKRFQDAIGVFEQAEQEANSGQTELLDAQFYFAYGAAAEETGQVDKAADLIKKSIQLDPQSAAEAYNYLGYMWVDRGIKIDEGGDLIKKALQMEPDNPAYVDSLGWYYFKKGDLKRSVETLRKAATHIQPEDAVVDEHLGDAYAASNDTADALDYWQRASAIDKENKEIAVKIAGARQKLVRQGTPANTTP